MTGPQGTPRRNIQEMQRGSRPRNIVTNNRQMLLEIKESLQHLHVNPDTASNGGHGEVLRRDAGRKKFGQHQKKLEEIRSSLGLSNGVGEPVATSGAATAFGTTTTTAVNRQMLQQLTSMGYDEVGNNQAFVLH